MLLLLLSDAVRELSNPPVAISNIVYGICHKLQVFQSIQMSHIKQGGNKPVHMLAKYAIRIGSFVTWVKENPVIFKSALDQDVLNLFHLNKVTCLFINQKKKKIYIYIYRRSFGQYHIDAYLEQYSIYSCKFS